MKWSTDERVNELLKAMNQENDVDTFESEYLREDRDNKPKQYSKGIDTFQRADSNLTPEANLAICVFLVDKYIWRDKGSDLEDFKKARDYIDRAINIMEKK